MPGGQYLTIFNIKIRRNRSKPKNVTMKKTIIATGVVAFLLAGCTGKAAKEAEKARAAEIEQLETVSTQIDSTITEIDEAAMKLDTLLNEL